MKSIPLCPEDETAPLYAAPRRNPAFPTRSGAGDYLDLVSIQGLVDETLAFLGAPESTVVTVKWDRATSRHGVAKRAIDTTYYRDVIQPQLDALNQRIRAREITKKAAQAELARHTAGAPVTFVLGFSRPVFELATVESRVETIIHEACHVAAPAGAGHGPEWAALMLRCGLSPERTSPAPDGLHPTWSCRKCGKRGTMAPKMAAQVLAGTRVLCNACGAPVAVEDVVVPATAQRKVDLAARKLQRAVEARAGVLPGLQKNCVICGQDAVPGKKTCGSSACQSRYLAFLQGRQ